MTGTDHLDGEIRRLITQIGDAAGPTRSLTELRARQASDPPAPATSHSRRRWAALTVSAVVLAGAVVAAIALAARDNEAGVQLQPADLPAGAPESTDPAILPPTSRPPEASTSTEARGDPASPGILRPITPDDVCLPISAHEVEATFGPDSPIFPFTLRSLEPITLQIIGDADSRAAAPFAVVLRYFEGGPRQAAVETRGGMRVWVTTHPNGNGEAVMEVGDGSRGYVRSRGIDRDDLVAIVDALSPRDASHAVPGFDYTPATDQPTAFGLLQEGLNTDPATLSRATLECLVPTPLGSLSYRVDALQLEPPLFAYLAVIDRRPPAEVGYVGSTLVVINGRADPAAPSVSDVTEADPSAWSLLLANFSATMEELGSPGQGP